MAAVRSPPWLNKLLGHGLVLVVAWLLLSVWPEQHAREAVRLACASFVPGSTLPVAQHMTHAGRNFFACGFRDNTQSGAWVHVVGGWFPFGRDFCVVKVEQGRVASTHIVLGNIDHDCDPCAADIRPIVDIPTDCSQPARQGNG